MLALAHTRGFLGLPAVRPKGLESNLADWGISLLAVRCAMHEALAIGVSLELVVAAPFARVESILLAAISLSLSLDWSRPRSLRPLSLSLFEGSCLIPPMRGRDREEEDTFSTLNTIPANSPFAL